MKKFKLKRSGYLVVPMYLWQCTRKIRFSIWNSSISKSQASLQIKIYGDEEMPLDTMNLDVMQLF